MIQRQKTPTDPHGTAAPDPTMPDLRVVAPTATEGEAAVFDTALRPTNFDEYIGQKSLKDNLQIFIQAAKGRREPLEHTLLAGPPGLGKTTLAHLIATTLSGNLRITSGPALERPGDLAAILTSLQPGDILFIDEIHRLKIVIEEVLYTAMEDYALDLVLGKGPAAKTMRLTVPPFTLVGATTRLSGLSAPLRDRFGHVFKLDFYTPAEIRTILDHSSARLHITMDTEAADHLSRCSRRTPRIANRLLRRMRDYAAVAGEGHITAPRVTQSLQALGIDELGLDAADRALLEVLCGKFAGGPVGLSTLAAATAEEVDTIETVIEPYLIQLGLLQRTPRGRMATPAGWRQVGLVMPKT